MARPEKVAEVEAIAARFQSADAALLTEYRGLSVAEMQQLRRDLRGANADYKVLKNSLARIAVKEVGLDELVEMLQGPTAIAFVRGDAVEAAKALDQAASKMPVLVIKGGVLRGRVIGGDQAKELAKLEPRETQLATIAMMANQPLQQTVNALAALLRDLGSMLAQVLQDKESAAPETPAEEEQPAAEAPAEPEGAAAEAPAEEEGPAPEAPAEPEGAAAGSEETLENPEAGPAPQAEPDETPLQEQAEQDEQEEAEGSDKEEK